MPFPESPPFALKQPVVFVLPLFLRIKKETKPCPQSEQALGLLLPPFPGGRGTAELCRSHVPMALLSLEEKWHRLHGWGRNQIKPHHPHQLVGQLLSSLSQSISQEQSGVNCVSNFCHKHFCDAMGHRRAMRREASAKPGPQPEGDRRLRCCWCFYQALANRVVP